jgi:hypothetical protein
LTISGNNASRIFNIQSGKTVTISGLTLNNGNAGGGDGGGVLNGGTLTVNGLIDGSTGRVDLSAGQDVQINQPILNPRSGSALTVTAGGGIAVNAAIDGRGGASGGAVTLAASPILRTTRSPGIDQRYYRNPGSTTNIRSTIVVNTPALSVMLREPFNSQGNNFIGKRDGSAGH